MSRYTDEFLVDIARIVEDHGTSQLSILARDLARGDPENLKNLLDELERAKHSAFEPLERWVTNLSESESESSDKSPSPDWASGEIARIPETNPYASIDIPELRNPRGAKIFGDILNTLISSDHFRSYWTNAELARELDIPVSPRDNRNRLMEKVIVRLSDMDTFELSQARVRIREILNGKSRSDKSRPSKSSQRAGRRSRDATFIAGGAYISQSESDEDGDEVEEGDGESEGLGDWFNF